MSPDWQLRVYEQQRLVYTLEGSGSLEIGRQAVGEPSPFGESFDGKLRRLIIARLDEDTVSRKHVRIELIPNDQVRISNLSSKLPVLVEGASEIPPGKSLETPQPAVLTIGRKTIRYQPYSEVPGTNTAPLQSLIQATLPPLVTPMPRGMSIPRPSVDPGMGSEQLIRWLQAAMGVLQGVAGSREFFPRAARAVVDLVGLDTGRVLLFANDEWKVEATEQLSGDRPSLEWRPSREVLSSLMSQKRTFWIGPQGGPDRGQSLVGVEAVVAAPILNSTGEVIGALYGDRRINSSHGSSSQISRLEAMLVELLASGVAAGLACMEQEQAALRARVQFEQFFTPELTRQLEREPDLLDGRDSEITVLFCDIRNFSRYSEQLGPEKTVAWLGDILGELSECVLRHQGVLVDYIGDELMAMWGAPVPQPDQARLASAAALDMLDLIPALSARWESTLGGPVGFGVGVNTGIARVGNMGTERKFKYGPLGSMVNIASRVQGATKYLKCPLLITRETHSQLGQDLPTRRICQVRVVNIKEPMGLYELAPKGQTDWVEFAQRYEAALERFEKHDHEGSMRLLFQFLNDFPDDGPALVLLSRVIALRDADLATFDPVWELPGK